MKNEYFEVVRQLRKHHSLFAQFWTVGNILEVDHPKMPTAAVRFDKKSGAGVQFLINPTFWATLNDHSKAFVIAHEVMHVYLDHGRRSLDLDPKMSNIAQDVVINHYLIDCFGFDRNQITGGEKYCWLDTVFPGRTDVEPNRCFEYYYQKLLEQGGAPQSGQGDGEGQPGEGQPGQPGQPGQDGSNQTVDCHEFMEDDEEIDEDVLDAIQKAAEDLMDRITEQEVENFEEIVEKGNSDEAGELEKQKASKAGAMAGTMQKRIRLGRVKKKPKWETVIANELGRFQGMERDVDLELWTRDNRRISTMAGDLMLPAEITETVPVRDRVDVWFFQDTSGSCVNLAKRFFAAAASIPEDRFRIRMFCFDTKVYETSLKTGKLYGFGGTAFQPMEDAIQGIIQREPKTKYPQAIFVVTDGENWDGRMNPEFPERWHFFLSSNTTRGIHQKSKNYKLHDYE